jgi:hypothetical protein
MELTKADKRQLHDLVKRGVLRRCEEWLKETAELINKEYGEDENAFSRCMEITKRSRDYFKEAMRREGYYRNSMLLMGVDELLNSGYLTIDDFKNCRPEIQEKVRQTFGDYECDDRPCETCGDYVETYTWEI